jgi:hypothetical protein
VASGLEGGTSSLSLDIMIAGFENHDVRTTLTLDDDVSARLRMEVRRTGKSLKQVVNECLRLGFERRRSAEPARKFKVRPFQAGPPPGMTFDNVEELIGYQEGPWLR